MARARAACEITGFGGAGGAGGAGRATGVITGGGATGVEMTGGADRVKVHGTVLQSDRLTGAAIVRVNPQAVSMRRPIEPGCENPNRPSAAYQDVVTAVTSPMFGGKELADGEVQRVTAQAYFVDMRLSRDAGGSPVFTACCSCSMTPMKACGNHIVSHCGVTHLPLVALVEA